MGPQSYYTSPYPSDLPMDNTLLSVLSWNVRGLNNPQKRKAILDNIKKLGAKVVFLQETHFKHNKTPKVSNWQYQKSFHAPFLSKQILWGLYPPT